MKGSIFTTLSVVNLKATPTEPGPIQRLELGTLNLRYSLVDLIRIGLPAFLKEVDLRNVYVEITPGEPLPPEKEEKPQKFQFPALFPELLNIENVNVLVTAPTGNTVVEGFFFSLLPDKPGVLKIQTLDIPGVRRWEGIEGHTTYRDRNLMLTDLVVGPEIILKKFNLDMSDLENDKISIALDGTFFEAPTVLTARVSDLNESNQLELNADVIKLNFQKIWTYLNMPPPILGDLDALSVTFSGLPEKPSSWSGKVTTGLSQLDLQGQSLGRLAVTADLGGARAVVDVRSQVDDRNGVTVKAEAALPETLDAFPKTSAKGRMEVAAPDLGLLTGSLPQPMVGDASVVGDFQLEGGWLNADVTIDAVKIAAAQAEISGTRFTIHAKKGLTLPPEVPFFQSLETRLEGVINHLRFDSYEAETFQIKATTREAEVKLEQLSLVKAGNSVAIQADYTMPADAKSWDAQPLDFDLSIDAPELQAFVAEDSGADLRGMLKVKGKGASRDKVITGSFAVEGRDISANQLPVETIDAQISIADNLVTLSKLNVVLDQKNTIQGNGEIKLGEAMAYHGDLAIKLDDLSLFQPLLGQTSAPMDIGGALLLKWKGNGDAAKFQHFGSATLDLRNAFVGDTKNLRANFNAVYTPEYINIPDVFLSAGDLGEAMLSLFWKENRLQISHLAVRQKKLTLLEGSVDLPLHLAEAQNVDKLLPSTEPLSIALRTSDLNLRALFQQLGETNPPVVGTVNLSIDGKGTLDELDAKIALRATRLQSTAADDFAPADVSVDVTMLNDRLNIDGTVRQALIQPLRISGNMPLDVAAIKQAQAIDPATPLDFQVRLPSSSLAFVSTLVPAIRQSRGTAEVDVKIGGTIASPVFSGNVAADMQALRFTDPSLPPVNAFALRLSFARDRLVIDRCVGGVGGGSFQVAGNITFSPLDNPVFNLRIGAKNALVMQNDDLSARISSDLRITGPLNAGSVQGTVWVTRSRFFKNIDILPIGLPGRPAPQPPEDPPVISFPTPPLRDWKFDVAIRTADPFLVQSNLATGRILIDLRLGGTGLEPWLDGSINIERLTASLPFSRLNIQSGLIYFNRADPFIPRLNLQGTSTIRDYNVTVYITGAVTAPDAVFTSDPPLPQAEVVSLIATGMTTSELSRDPNALAGRAAILLFQRAYNSVFRRNKPPAENESFLSRIQFDIGATDPKTGRQSATLGIPLSDQIMLTGGLDVGGNFRGQVKYLIRFK